MARKDYGVGPDSVVSFVDPEGDLAPVSYAMTAWNAEVGGSQLTDLQDKNGNAIQSVTPEAGTYRNRFKGPDGYSAAIYLESAPGVRWLMNPSDLAARLGSASVTEMTSAELLDGTITDPRIVSPAVLNAGLKSLVAVSNLHLQPTWDGTGTHPTRVAPPGVYELWRQPTAPLVDATHALDDDLWLATV
jgi:hypothetical protein